MGAGAGLGGSAAAGAGLCTGSFLLFQGLGLRDGAIGFIMSSFGLGFGFCACACVYIYIHAYIWECPEKPRPLVGRSRHFDPYSMDRSISPFMNVWREGRWNEKTLDDPYPMDRGMERLSASTKFHAQDFGIHPDMYRSSWYALVSVGTKTYEIPLFMSLYTHDSRSEA